MWNPRSLRPLPSPFRETDVTVTRDLKLALQYQAIISIFQYFIARELRVLCVRSDDQITSINRNSQYLAKTDEVVSFKD